MPKLVRQFEWILRVSWRLYRDRNPVQRGEKEANICAIAVSKAALTQWAGFDSAGYRAYVHFKNDRQFDQETMAAGNPLNEEMRQDILFADGVADVRFWLPGWCAGRKNSPWLSR